ncbi:unnamed protein product [Rotaria socialis]|uniref:NAD(P)(+)--arginine ADP-ribosyltransferase n=1 Tax=Rotaria socialis TaxID=392032 RepID=A0A818WUJ1_9BILA|nr:unnamed protein product [Rotaria socialis]
MYSNINSENNVQLRFMNIEKPMTRRLTPLGGYAHLPLVTLEEAVGHLDLVVPKIQHMAYIAKEYAANLNDELSIDQSAAIVLYTLEWLPHETSFFFILNKTLRLENRNALTPWLHYLKLLFTALWHLPTKKGTVYRGTRDLQTIFRKGQRITWWCFTSCTTVADTLQSDQLCGTSGNRTIFNIDCYSAKDIKHHSYFKSENEVLLLPGTEFIVVAVLDLGHGLTNVQMKEIEPKFPNRELIYVSKAKVIAPNPSISMSSRQPTPAPISNRKNSSSSQISNPGEQPKNAWFNDSDKPKHATAVIILVTITSLIALGISLMAIIVGARGQYECNIQSWIPKWLIGLGVSGLVCTIALIIIGLTYVCCRCTGTGFKSCTACLAFLSLLFFLAWMITGSVWVFSKRSMVQYENSLSSDYCQKLVYNMAFGLLLTQYSLLGLILCCGVCGAVVACFF